MHTSLAPGAQIFYRHEWRKLATFLFILFVLLNLVDGYLDWVFACSVVRKLGWNLLVLQFQWNVCKVLRNWIDHEWVDFGFFCWNVTRLVVVKSVSSKIYQNGSLLFLFWRHKVFSNISLRGILICSLWVPVHFSQISF